jgi:hypothetical protein
VSDYKGAACPHCGVARDVRTIVSGRQNCPVCHKPFEAVRFDPPAPDTTVPRLADAGPGGAHACPQHPANATVANCGRCGVFVCALCRIEVEARVLCPACFDRLDEENALPALESSYRDYGRMQSTLVLLGLLAPCVGFIAGPGAVYYGVNEVRRRDQRGEAGGRVAIHLMSAVGVIEALASVALIVWLVKQ